MVVSGSSPLTRGKRVPRGARQGPLRFIPAHAGKTFPLSSCVRCGGAHPRSRGENLASASTVLKKPGSSPLTRGKRVWRGGDCGERGLIPTHAGKTLGAQGAAKRPWAHPHSRGENRRPLGPPERRMGSSPLTRGKRLVVDKATFKARLIPTHARKT